MTKKFLIALSAVVCAFFILAAPAVACSAEGIAEITIELSTGTILSAKNENERMPMASTTKIMTALIVIEDCDPDEVITVPDEAVGVEGSSIYLKKDEQISIKDLIYGLMLRSGNDSAAALAIHHSGSVEAFVGVMNEKAAALGADNTHFKNPSGLPDPEHYTTASDLGKITCAAMKNRTFREVVGTKNYTGQFRSYVNKNKMLTTVDGANGVKTGYTQAAGRCLVSSAERGGMDVVCVVLNCPDMYERSQKLLEKAFSEYEVKKISADTVFMCDIVPCKLQEDCDILVKKSDKLEFETQCVIQPDRVRRGDYVGQLKIFSQNNLIFSQKLYSIIDR